MASRGALTVAGLLLALATVCAALGSHALRAELTPDRLNLWDMALRYHFIQALGLLGIGVLLRAKSNRVLRAAATLIAAGIVLFSGSLYALSLGAPHTIAHLTPLGGLAWIVGWLAFAWGAWHN